MRKANVETFFIPPTPDEDAEFSRVAEEHMTFGSELIPGHDFPNTSNPVIVARTVHAIQRVFGDGFTPLAIYMKGDNHLAVIAVTSGRPGLNWRDAFEDEEQALMHSQMWMTLFPFSSCRHIDRVVFVADALVHAVDEKTGEWADDGEALMVYDLQADKGLTSTMTTYHMSGGVPVYDKPETVPASGGPIFDQFVRALARRREVLDAGDGLSYEFLVWLMAGNEYETLVMR